jgi:PhzF family phenazine biosynthesis protein
MPHAPRRFHQLDVFTDVAGYGNPLAVVHGAEGLTDEAMQRFACWTNLSETAYLRAPTHPEADYALRIFTPVAELGFAGHPTLGSAMAFLLAGGAPKHGEDLVQQCAVGNVRIRRAAGRLAFAAPPYTESVPSHAELETALRALGVSHMHVTRAAWLDNGTRWLGIALDENADLGSVSPDHVALARLGKVGLVAPAVEQGCLFEVRAFAAAAGIEEDPVTGGLNASLAQWLIGLGAAPASYVVSQGRALGRRGRVNIDRDGSEIWVGGQVTPVIAGDVQLG